MKEKGAQANALFSLLSLNKEKYMYEKVNPMHPDKIADRIAGTLVDMAYRRVNNPRIAVEVLIGHGVCNIICETSVKLPEKEVYKAVHRIAGDVYVNLRQLPQDVMLAANQQNKMRCGDNGIFCGYPVTPEQKLLTCVAHRLYHEFPFDGKYILDGKRLIICQSNAATSEIETMYPNAEINPIGSWTGGTDVDTGAVNRKLGSDMGDSVTGGGLHGKDLSKADVSVNIYAWLKAQITEEPVEISCAIGDEVVDGLPYEVIVEIARRYIGHIGGFEKFAEWGLIR